MKLKMNTPIEVYKVRECPIHVKREDLCTPNPGPPFSKVRGLWDHMKYLKSKGVNTVGYTESAISMAGWGVAWVAKCLKMRAVIFDPQYKNETPELLKLHRERWLELGAETHPVEAGRTIVNNYICIKELNQLYPKAVMLPIGLRLEETVNATAVEWERTRHQLKSQFYIYPENYHWGSIVVCVGSGTICAGILRGWRKKDGDIVGVMAYGDDANIKRQHILDKAGMIEGGLFEKDRPNFEVHAPGWKYTEKSETGCPFPCHPYYDLKAWEWLKEHIGALTPPVLFWNIGSECREGIK